MARRRLGVALLLEGSIATEVNGLRRGLQSGALERIPPHITLVPPVNVREDQLDEVLHILRAAASKTKPFVSDLGPVASFAPDTPVVFLAVENVTAIKALRDKVFLGPLSRELTWPYVPHVTLTEDLPQDHIDAAVQALDYRVAANFDRVYLLQEINRIWTPIADYTFEPVAIIGRGGIPVELTTTKLLDPAALRFLDAHDVVIERTSAAVTARIENVVVGVMWNEDDVVVTRDWQDAGIEDHLRSRFVRTSLCR